MNADIKPLEIAFVLLIEILFGIGYNALVDWAHRNHLWHVSISVTAGVIGTLLIPGTAWFKSEMPFWLAGILLTACFTASGIPMIAGSTRRTVRERDQKKRRPWPHAAVRVRDDVVMELSSMAQEIAEKAKAQQLAVSDLPDYVNRLYSAIGMLRSV